MLISDSHGFVFVHVRKAAGTSLRERLAPYALPPSPGRLTHALSRAGLIGNYRRHLFRAHAPLLEAQRRMPAETFGAYFKFGFVRDPWERLVSEYEYIRSHPQHARHKKLRAMAFAQFVDFQIPRPDAYQFDMLCDENGQLSADFVGRFERLQEDFENICVRLGIAPRPLAHLNRTNCNDYRSYYNDVTAERVGANWRREIEAFGYRFE